MKTLKTLLKTMTLSAGAFVLLGASGLFAQTKAAVDVPFEFTVQNTALPAGHYTMEHMLNPASRNTLLIRSVETQKAIFVLAPSGETEYKGPRDKNVVLFHKIGDRYFLAEVKTDGVHGHVSPSKLERELTAEGSGSPMAAVIVPASSPR